MIKQRIIYDLISFILDQTESLMINNNHLGPKKEFNDLKSVIYNQRI